MKVRAMVLAIVAVLAATPSASAQQQTGEIFGKVTDQQSAMVPGVTVVVRNQATGTERSLVTDASGEYLAAAFLPLPPAGIGEAPGSKETLPSTTPSRGTRIAAR